MVWEGGSLTNALAALIVGIILVVISKAVAIEKTVNTILYIIGIILVIVGIILLALFFIPII